MNLGIDGIMWHPPETGIAVATRNLVTHLARLPLNFGHVKCFVTEDSTLSKPTPSIDRTECVLFSKRWRSARRMVWQHLMLPVCAIKHNIDVLYCPCYTSPVHLPSHVALVVTIHDTIAWQRPDLCRWTNVLHLHTRAGPSIQRAQAITVPTEAVRDNVQALFNVPDGKVHVVPWAVRPDIVRLEVDTAKQFVKSAFGVDGSYALFVGNIEPKKNIATLMSATSLAGVPLVVAGPCTWEHRRTRIFRHAAPSTIRYLGYVTHLELSALYSAADVFVFPSHVEGFGLPVVEAMACGVPVVTSDTPALLEVCGGAALHVPCTDVRHLAECIRCVVWDKELRAEYIRRGTARAGHFSWNRSAMSFWNVLQSIA